MIGDDARYPISEGSKIVGQNLATSRSWFQKAWLYSPSDKRAERPGSTTLISGRSVLALAVADRLATLGMHPATACSVATEFTVVGDEDREPGGLWAKGFTALIAYPDGSSSVLPLNNPVRDIAFPSGASGAVNGRQEAAYFLLLDFIVKHVEISLKALDDRFPSVSVD